MPAPARKSSSVITYRAKQSIALPPMILGYDNLLEPETFDPDKPKLTMNGHLTPAGIRALQEVITTKVYAEDALAKLKTECEENGLKCANSDGSIKVRSAEEWLEGKLREPKPEAPVAQLPFIKLENSATYFRRIDGELVQQNRTINAWDGHNRQLNLKRLMLGRGSVVEPVVFPNLYFSKLNGFAAPSLKLIGVRVLELVQFQKGGSNAPAEADSEAIREVLGRDLKADDLSAFMGDDEPEDDIEDEDAVAKAPKEGQSPQDRAKGMF